MHKVHKACQKCLDPYTMRTEGRKGKMREEEEASGTAIDAGEIRNRCMGARRSLRACQLGRRQRREREKHFYSASGTLKIEIREIKIKQLQSLESEESGIN